MVLDEISHSLFLGVHRTEFQRVENEALAFSAPTFS
jgi:hypothetical protein